MAFYEAAGAWASEVGVSVAAHLWQGTVFAVFVVALALLLRNAPARLRYDLYLLASAKFLLPSVLLFSFASTLSWDPSFGLSAPLETLFDFDRVLASLTAVLFGAADHSGSVSVAGGGGLWLAALVLWAVPAVLLLALWSRRLLRFRAVLARGRRVDPQEDVALRLQALRHQLGLRRQVAVVLCRNVAEPGVWGVFRPVIILPTSMARHLGSGELEAVLLHELVHVQRWDNLVGHLHMVLRSVLWFHPLVWWLDRRLLAERERACDERVIQVSGDSAAYLRGLAKVLRWVIDGGVGGGFGGGVDRRVGGRLAGVSSVYGSDLRRRISLIRCSTPSGVSLAHRLALVAACLLLGVSSLAAGPLCGASSPFVLESPRQLLARVVGCSTVLDSQQLPKEPTACPRPSETRSSESDCADSESRIL